jgi:hypothetical protein
MAAELGCGPESQHDVFWHKAELRLSTENYRKSEAKRQRQDSCTDWNNELSLAGLSG